LFPVLAVAPDGHALLAWARAGRIGEEAEVVVAERPPGGSFGEPVLVSAPGADAFGAAVATAAGGDGALAWIRNETTPYELHVRGFDASAPTLSGVAIPPTATAGVPASFAASAFDLWGPATIRWDFGDGATAAGSTVQHAYTPGTYSASVVATDAVGLSAPAQTGIVRVAGLPTESGPPALSGASVRPAAFRVGRAPTAVSAARRRGARRRRSVPAGTTFGFTLDRAATVTISFARRAPGLRSGTGRGVTCARPSRRLRRARARRCTRSIPAGALTRRGSPGSNAVPFSGRVGRRALAPGRYRATFTASADGSAGAPRTLSFRVVR
ncbi:MAG TPA: PKD domain-containing protein, partial [Conexibacter sp.]|nr:PKD domain-containing protein [Conexibacter sp.]